MPTGQSYGSIPAFRKTRAGKPGGFQGFPVRSQTPKQRVNLPSPGARKSPYGNREGARYAGPVGVEQWTPGQVRSATRQPMIGGQTPPTVRDEIGTALRIQPVNTRSFDRGSMGKRGMAQSIDKATFDLGGSVLRSRTGDAAVYMNKGQVWQTTQYATRTAASSRKSSTSSSKKITYGGRSRKSR